MHKNPWRFGIWGVLNLYISEFLLFFSAVNKKCFYSQKKTIKLCVCFGASPWSSDIVWAGWWTLRHGEMAQGHVQDKSKIHRLLSPPGFSQIPKAQPPPQLPGDSAVAPCAPDTGNAVLAWQT